MTGPGFEMLASYLLVLCITLIIESEIIGLNKAFFKVPQSSDKSMLIKQYQCLFTYCFLQLTKME